MHQFVLLTLVGLVALSQAQWQRGAVDLHNKYRQCHGAAPLSFNANSEVSRSAQRCADYLASKKQMAHVCSNVFKTSYGENLASGSGAVWNDASSAAIKSTEMWYNEVSQHNFNGAFQYQSGHFSQVVWKGSKNVGIGYAKNGSFTIVVAHYDPPGNWNTVDNFKQNVIRSRRVCRA